MEETRVKLSAIWGALMLTYLLGDVLRLYSGDFMPGGELGGRPVSPEFWMDAALYEMQFSGYVGRAWTSLFPFLA